MDGGKNLLDLNVMHEEDMNKPLDVNVFRGAELESRATVSGSKNKMLEKAAYEGGKNGGEYEIKIR